MANTPILGIPYPDEDAETYYDVYVSQMRELERLTLSAKIQNNLIIGGGGTVSFNAGTNLLNWTSDFTLPVLVFGKKITVSFGPDAATRQAALSEGSALVLEIPLSMNTDITRSFQVLNQLDINNHLLWVAAIRLGGKVLFRGLGPIG